MPVAHKRRRVTRDPHRHARSERTRGTYWPLGPATDNPSVHFCERCECGLRRQVVARWVTATLGWEREHVGQWGKGKPFPDAPFRRLLDYDGP